jgi:hypothetical protein
MDEELGVASVWCLAGEREGVGHLGVQIDHRVSFRSPGRGGAGCPTGKQPVPCQHRQEHGADERLRGTRHANALDPDAT